MDDFMLTVLLAASMERLEENQISDHTPTAEDHRSLRTSTLVAKRQWDPVSGNRVYSQLENLMTSLTIPAVSSDLCAAPIVHGAGSQLYLICTAA